MNSATSYLALLLPLVFLMGSSAPREAGAPSLSVVISELRALPEEERYLFGEVPEVAKSGLTRLKHELRDLAARALNETPPAETSADTVRERVVSDLKQHGIMVGEESKGLGYGYVTDLSIVRVSAHPDLLAVTTTVGVTCGGDTSFYLFDGSDGAWRLILAQEANEYEDISGAQGPFMFRVSEADASSSYFVVTANGTPWCTSCWSALRFRVMRPGSSPYEPTALGQGEHWYYRCAERELELTPVGFFLRFQDLGDDNIPHWRRIGYVVENDVVRESSDEWEP